MGDIISKSYGVKSKNITGILSFLYSLSKVSIQILALGYVFDYILEIDMLYGTLIGGGIVTLYSAVGGIRAVISTDVIQFIVLVVVLPIICNIAVLNIGGYQALPIEIPPSHTRLFDHDFFSLYVIIFLSYCIPKLYPDMVQRSLIAKNKKQFNISMNITIVVMVLVFLAVSIIGIVTKIKYPEIKGSESFLYMLKQLIPTGISGLMIAGLLAVTMSTADSALRTRVKVRALGRHLLIDFN